MSKEPAQSILDPRYAPKMVTKLEKHTITKINKNGVYNIKPDRDGLECFGGITIEVNVNDNLRTGYNTFIIPDEEQPEPPEYAEQIDDVVEDEVITITSNTRTNLQPFSLTSSSKKLVKKYSIFTNVQSDDLDGVLIDWCSGRYYINQYVGEFLSPYAMEAIGTTIWQYIKDNYPEIIEEIWDYGPQRLTISDNVIDLDEYYERFNAYYERLESKLCSVFFLLEDCHVDSNNEIYCKKLSIARIHIISSQLTRTLRIDGELPSSILQVIYDLYSEGGTPICEFGYYEEIEEYGMLPWTSDHKAFKLNALQPISETETKCISLQLPEEYIREEFPSFLGEAEIKVYSYYPSPDRTFDLYNTSNTKCAELWISKPIEGKFYI